MPVFMWPLKPHCSLGGHANITHNSQDGEMVYVGYENMQRMCWNNIRVLRELTIIW